VEAPWVLKPRSEASASGIIKDKETDTHCLNVITPATNRAKPIVIV
jgi:hypothetical protein